MQKYIVHQIYVPSLGLLNWREEMDSSSCHIFKFSFDKFKIPDLNSIGQYEQIFQKYNWMDITIEASHVETWILWPQKNGFVYPHQAE